MSRLGIWTIGAYGAVGTTAAAGAAAIARGVRPPTGMVTSLPMFDALDLVPLDDVVFGGVEVRAGPWSRHAEGLVAERVFDRDVLDAARPALDDWDRWVTDGSAAGCGGTVGEMADRPGARESLPPKRVLERARESLRAFRHGPGCDRVVAVNVASTEPHLDVEEEPMLQSADALDAAIRASEPVPASVLYALAAIREGCPYVNFTPSTGSSVPALIEEAARRGVPHMGQDGKTGETLVKTVLAPMFAARNLRVLSWEGHNILGNRDGAVLRDPASAKGKLANKDETLRRILPDPEMHSRVRIDYVPSLGDWKTAWDFIHFEGFLGTRMNMQFTWQGCDSALAAPLLLDLVRLADAAARRGEGGLMPHLACFFKNPTGVAEQCFEAQFAMLAEYAVSTAGSISGSIPG